VRFEAFIDSRRDLRCWRLRIEVTDSCQFFAL
jgi:hypothetical protein